MQDFNKVVFAGEYSIQDVVESCQVMPIMDAKRLVIAKDYSGKGDEKEKGYLQKYLESPSPDTCFVMFATKQVPLFVSCLNKVEPVDCNKLTPDMLKRVINSRLAQSGKKIEKAAIDYLVEACSGSFTASSKEADKLVAYAGANEIVTLAMVESIVTKNIENVVYDLTNAIAEKNGDKAYAIVNNLLDHGNQPTALISLITGQFRRLFFVSITEGDNAELAKQLGVKEGAIFIAKKQAKAFGPKTLKLICEKCIDAEFKIKNGKMEGVNAINYLVAEILSY
jgi:DNA polymerase-3 subunit delta